MAWGNVSKSIGGGGISAVNLGSGSFGSGAMSGTDYWSDRDPFSGAARSGNKARHESEAKAQELYQKSGDINKTLTGADTEYQKQFTDSSNRYLNRADYLTNAYEQRIGRLKDQATSQASDARATYTNSILPEFKNAMQTSRQNASQAMSLAEASDPNNPIMKGIRDLYNKQGESVRKQGQQDFGVLSSLGAQAAQGQFGASGPMTSGMMGQIYGANQAQAGDAYARAQQRVSELQNQGLERSFDQSNKIYDFGQQAQDRYAGSIGNLEGAQNRFADQQGRFRDELGGYEGNIYGVNQGLNQDRFNIGMTGSDIARGSAYAGGGREQAALDQLYGSNQQAINNQLQARLANNSSGGNIIGSTIGGVASVMASDERTKKGISRISDSDLDEFLCAVEPKTFSYKEPDKEGRAPGQRIGFMLQDVQGTKLGDDMTRKGPEGELMYDKDNLDGILLAALSRQAKGKAA